MVRPAAPWVGWGLGLWLVSWAVAAVPLPFVAWWAWLPAAIGSVALAVGVHRLVLHADRAAGVRPPEELTAPASDEELARQAAAREALVREAEGRPAAPPDPVVG